MVRRRFRGGRANTEDIHVWSDEDDNNFIQNSRRAYVGDHNSNYWR